MIPLRSMGRHGKHVHSQAAMLHTTRRVLELNNGLVRFGSEADVSCVEMAARSVSIFSASAVDKAVAQIALIDSAA